MGGPPAKGHTLAPTPTLRHLPVLCLFPVLSVNPGMGWAVGTPCSPVGSVLDQIRAGVGQRRWEVLLSLAPSPHAQWGPLGDS